MFVRNELRQLHEGSEQTGDTIDWNGDGSDEDAVHDLHQDERNNQYAKKRQQYCLSNFSLLNISSSGNGTILRPGARYQAIQHHQAFKLFFLLKMLTLHSSKENLVFKENILLAGCGRCMLWRRRRKCLEMDDAKVGSSNHPNRHLSPYSYLPHSNPHPHSDPQPNPHKGYSYITTMQFLAFKQLYT